MIPYEPKGKTAVLVSAMRAAPGQPIWSLDECALVMDLPRSSVPPYLKTALEKGLMHRRLSERNQPEFSLKPFPTVAPAQDPRAPQFDRPWVPPKMIAVRPGSEPVPPSAPSPAPAPITTRKPLCAGCTRSICWDKGCVAGKAQDLIIPTFADAAAAVWVEPPAPQPAPAVMAPSPAAVDVDPLFLAAHYGHDLRPGDGMVGIPAGPAGPADPAPAAAEASIPEGGGGGEAEVDEDVIESDVHAEEDEEVEPDAFYSCRTGEIVLVGLEMDEDGRVTVPADLVMAIRRAVAWAPPPRGTL